jgi:hypothetical protein
MNLAKVATRWSLGIALVGQGAGQAPDGELPAQPHRALAARVSQAAGQVPAGDSPTHPFPHLFRT